MAAELEDEEVIFENSPLEKYLKEAGFVDFNPEKLNSKSVAADFQSVDNCTNNGILGKRSGLAKWISFFVNTNNSLPTRQEYVSTVISSGTLSEDDFMFLQQFDPELFDIPVQESKEVMGQKVSSRIMLCVDGWTPEILLSFLVLLTGMFIAPGFHGWISNYKGLAVCIGALLITAPIGYYAWGKRNQKYLHHKNVRVLKDYTNQVKSFVHVFRRSIMLIQELELISKGYTLVGLQVGHHQSDSEESKKDIYPNLRQCLLDNGMNVLMTSCSYVEKMAMSYPFAPEVNNVFTCISADPLSQFGLEVYPSLERLSLSYLKLLLSVLASQQSEFLSRYLLSLSKKARNKTPKEFTSLESLRELHFGFYDQLAVVTKALKSVQLSYCVHKSALTFTGEKPLKHNPPSTTAQSKWTNYYTSVHSLELHLKACFTKIQIINANILAEIESEQQSLSSPEDPYKNESITKLDCDHQMLRNKLNSAICCWEEGFHSLKLMSGVEQSDNALNKEDSCDEDNLDKHTPTSVNNLCLQAPEENQGDCVFEGYTDLYDESDLNQTLLTREELEKETRSQEESKHLLVELKNVLLTKSKDPLITDAGFVKPASKITNNKPGNSVGSTSEFNETNSKVDDCRNEEVEDSKPDGEMPMIQKVSASCKVVDQTSCTVKPMGYGERGVGLPEPKLSNSQPSKAFSIAIQNAARTRGIVLLEESFGSSDSD